MKHSVRSVSYGCFASIGHKNVSPVISLAQVFYCLRVYFEEYQLLILKIECDCHKSVLIELMEKETNARLLAY